METEKQDLQLPERRIETVERITRLEVNVIHIVDGIADLKSLLEKHIDADSCGSCKLDAEVITCKNDIKWMKRIGYTVGGSTVTLLIGKVTGILDKLIKLI